MLKIKNDVDLIELEKFGFKKLTTNEGIKYYSFKKEPLYANGYLSIFLKDREIWGTASDKLYDLIQAGFVEKVEGRK